MTTLTKTKMQLLMRRIAIRWVNWALLRQQDALAVEQDPCLRQARHWEKRASLVCSHGVQRRCVKEVLVVHRPHGL